MSHQALNIKNDNNWVKFDATAQLIDNIKHVLIQRNWLSLDISNVMKDNILNEFNNYRFVFDMPTEMEIQDDIDKIIKKNIKPPTPSPPYLQTLWINNKLMI